jgi:multidrug resistance efflux pump
VKSLRPSQEEVVPREKANPDAARIEVLRGKVIGWKSKISRLSSDRNQAQSAASYGSQSSVPGSLETWQARAARLGAELAKARAEHAAAKAALAAVAPNDPLLQPDPSVE